MSAVPSQHPKYRTKLCRNFSSGNCPFGQKCSFLHPAPGINPFSSSLAQYLFNWNMLLPQLLALSTQQATLKKTQRPSPPPPQGPELIDEDSSPAASLLLSTSDCTSSEQMPQTRRSSRRKKLPCKQFIRTGGWCPAGAKCRFHHDVTALPSADGQKVQHAPPFETDVPMDVGRTISGNVLMGIQMPSPAVIGQEYSEPPRYTEAEPAQPCQPLYWPSYSWQPYQPYYATVPATAAVPVPSTMAPSSAMQHNIYHPPPRPSVQNVPPAETRTSLPLGAYEVNGTTYFPSQMSSVPAPPPVTCSVPVHPASYSHTMAPAYPYYAAYPIPTSYCDIPNQTMDVRPQTCFDPFSSDPTMPSELPVVSRLEDYPMLPVQRDDLPHLLSSPFVLHGDVGSTNAMDKPRVAKGPEFPYEPPKNQQVGHARRISINIKKQARANSG